MIRKFIMGTILMIITIILVGCKDDNPKVFDNEISIDCTAEVIDIEGENKEDLIVSSSTKGKFNKQGYLSWIQYINKEQAKTDEIYEERKQVNDPLTVTTDIDYKVDFNDEKRTITTTTTFDINYEEYDKKEQEDIKIKNYIKTLEESGYKCNITGINREELGLK